MAETFGTEVRTEDIATYPQDETGLLRYLLDLGLLTAEGRNSVARVSDATKPGSLCQALLRSSLVADEALQLALCELLNLQVADSGLLQNGSVPTWDVSERFMLERTFLVVHLDDVALLITANPFDTYVHSACELATGRTLAVRIAGYAELRTALEARFGAVEDTLESAASPASEREDEDVERLKDLASGEPVIRFVNDLLAKAARRGASDIHLEPFEYHTRVRLRVDGVLHRDEAPATNMHRAIVSRLKLMAGLDIGERRLPQDGRAQIKVGGRDIDLRVATSPTLHGESVVLRLLLRSDLQPDITQLGYSHHAMARIGKVQQMAGGLILVTGPTGSGKTTTLYSMLSGLNDEGRKIITVEDPVEYYLEGINQIQVRSNIGLDFATTLRSIVRLDPDVIMVGEIRDRESAAICVESALTGHLVLSTLHTNDAVTAVARLLELGVEDYLLASTLSMVVAQRLVRTLCDRCKEKRAPSAEEKNLIRTTPGVTLKKTAALYSPVGCSHCHFTGYTGRSAVCEVMSIDTEAAALIRNNADEQLLAQLVQRSGMVPMWVDGLGKALAGETTLEEVRRVVPTSE